MSRRDFIAGYMAGAARARKMGAMGKSASGVEKITDISLGGDLIEIYKSNDVKQDLLDPFGDDYVDDIALYAAHNSVIVPNFGGWPYENGAGVSRFIASLNMYRSLDDLCLGEYGSKWTDFMLDYPMTIFDL